MTKKTKSKRSYLAVLNEFLQLQFITMDLKLNMPYVIIYVCVHDN